MKTYHDDGMYTSMDIYAWYAYAGSNEVPLCVHVFA